jgi:hypothetical protein
MSWSVSNKIAETVHYGTTVGLLSLRECGAGPIMQRVNQVFNNEQLFR